MQSSLIPSTSSNMRSMSRKIACGSRNLRGSPWVHPPDPFDAGEAMQRQGTSRVAISSAHVLNCVLRPTIFFWAPEKLCPGWRLPCPDCAHPTSFSAWAPPRVVHSLTGIYMYMCSLHACSRCSASDTNTRSTAFGNVSCRTVRMYWQGFRRVLHITGSSSAQEVVMRSFARARLRPRHGHADHLECHRRRNQ